jgi:hypothetical protein
MDKEAESKGVKQLKELYGESAIIKTQEERKEEKKAAQARLRELIKEETRLEAKKNKEKFHSGVYFIFTEGLVLIRIGEALAPSQRLSYIKKAQGFDLTMLYIPNNKNQRYNEEELIQDFHQRFKRDAKQNGWFYFTEDIQRYLKEMEGRFYYEIYGYKHSNIINEIVNTKQARENTIAARRAKEESKGLVRSGKRGRPRKEMVEENSNKELKRVAKHEELLESFVKSKS